MATFGRFFTERDIIREKIQFGIGKLRTITSLRTMKDMFCNLELQNKHIMIIHVIITMKENTVKTFIDKLTSFIIKWINMYEEAESDVITNIMEYFFSTDLTNFHIVFFIGVNTFIYSSHLDDVFISRHPNRVI